MAKVWQLASLPLLLASLSAQAPLPPLVIGSREELDRTPAATERLVMMLDKTTDVSPLSRFRDLRDLALMPSPAAGGAIHAAPLAGGGELQTLGKAHLAALRDLPLLDSLRVFFMTIDGEGLAELRQLPMLTTLRFESCDALDCAAAAVITGMKTLRSLALSHCDGLPKRAFCGLVNLQALRALDLTGDMGGGQRSKWSPGDGDGIGVDDDVLAAIATLPHLERLCLNRCFNLTANGMSCLEQCIALKDLDLTCLDACVPAAVESAPATLQSLSLSFCTVDATLLTRLAVRLRALRQLDLSLADGVDANSLAALAKLPALERLNLAQIKTLTDGNLAALGACPHLKELAIGGPNQLTVPGLRALAKLPMQCIDLQGGGDAGVLGGKGADQTPLDPDSVCKLASELWPGCRVIDKAGVEHVAR